MIIIMMMMIIIIITVISVQRKLLMSNILGLVDFAIGPVNSVLNLPDG